MLTITHAAAGALTMARAASGGPDTYGAYFDVTDVTEQGSARLAIKFVEGPSAGDDVSEQEGLPVYVAPEVKEVIPEATIDAKPIDGEPQLILERPTD